MNNSTVAQAIKHAENVQKKPTGLGLFDKGSNAIKFTNTELPELNKLDTVEDIHPEEGVKQKLAS